MTAVGDVSVHFDGDPLTLPDGTTISCGLDDAGIWVAAAGGLSRGSIVRLAAWSGGVGGLELVASPDRQHVALLIYSGQSSQGYEVFSLNPELSRVGGLSETSGHGSAPVFSPDGRWLLSMTDTERRVRGTGEYFEVLQDEHSAASVIVNWAQLHVQQLPRSEVRSVPVGVEVPLATDLDLVLGWRAYDAIGFTGNDRATLGMPWGASLVVPLPPPTVLTCRAFSTA